MTPLVSVIIVNHNTPELVKDCVDSIRRFLAGDYEIIIVESGLDRPLAEATISQWGAAHLPTTVRLGFGRANNLGAERATGRFLWLLNSDTILPDARINELFPLMDRYREVGLVSPVLYCDRELKKRQPGFYTYFQSFRLLLTRRLQPQIDWDSPSLPDVVICEKIPAAALVIRRELFRQLGGFDERYFMYMEDEDLCYRALRLGTKSGIATGSAVVHLQGKSISGGRERKRFYYESQTLFWETHHGRWPARLMRILRLPKRVLNG